MGEDYEAWRAAQETPLFRCARLNPNKIDEQTWQNEFPNSKRIESYPGLLYTIDESMTSLGNHPFHHAGCFYLQDPSASLAVEALTVSKGDKILDACASPGGKSTQILSRLDGSGLLVSNEIDAKRNLTLRFNIQRYGDDNVIVTQSDTQTIGKNLTGYFDKILIDAPCSGMGMFRKDPKGIAYFSQSNIDHCVRMQKEILENIYPCLKQDGILVYSTCTFSKEENEGQIESFLLRHPDMVIESLPFEIGRKGLFENNSDLSKSRRVTVLEGGEGHFICRMRKTGPAEKPRISVATPSKTPLVKTFVETYLDPAILTYMIGDRIYGASNPLPLLTGLNVTQIGAYIGQVINQRVEIDHAFATSKIAANGYFKNVLDLNESETQRFLRGETLFNDTAKGYVLVRYKGKIFALGKGDGQQIKNKFPKGLRTLQKFSENS